MINSAEEPPKKRQAKRKSAKPKVEEAPKFKCEFCKKDFARENTLTAHACERKRRWLSRDEKHARMGFMVYKKFYDMSYRNKKPRTYEDFMDSTHYSAFVRFGKYLTDIQAINPEAFVEFLVKAAVPLKNWVLPFVYEQYVRELNKKESADSAFERNVLLMQQWSMDSGEPWEDFFKKVNTNLATSWIRSGRLSPWVLYTAASAAHLFERFTEEQLSLIETYVTPAFWSRKLADNPEDYRFIRDVLKEAGL